MLLFLKNGKIFVVTKLRKREEHVQPFSQMYLFKKIAVSDWPTNIKYVVL
jgi:hypothetical protein